MKRPPDNMRQDGEGRHTTHGHTKPSSVSFTVLGTYSVDNRMESMADGHLQFLLFSASAIQHVSRIETWAADMTLLWVRWRKPES